MFMVRWCSVCILLWVSLCSSLVHPWLQRATSRGRLAKIPTLLQYGQRLRTSTELNEGYNQLQDVVRSSAVLDLSSIDWGVLSVKGVDRQKVSIL